MGNRNILITGASGNIGFEIIRGLKEIRTPHTIIAADYNTDHARKILSEFENLSYRKLDFSDPSGFDQALSGIDIVFLLRPPQLADIPRYFVPFVEALKKNKISKVVFLSVQGVESQSLIPHHKLEKLLVKQNMEYVFLRPGYFMQNLTTTLVDEIRKNNRIFIPAGKLKFNWVDARDIGLVGTTILNDFDKYVYHTPEITGSEFSGFSEVSILIGNTVNKPIKYVSPNLIRFMHVQRKKGMTVPMIMVMIMLHFLPRLGKNQEKLTSVVEQITGKRPNTLAEFIARESEKFM
jgi:uncharacterized protein YbjT (DUF2867 family)